MSLWKFTFVIFLVAGLGVYAQDDYQHIVDRNPFDPDRGQVEEVEETEAPEETRIVEEGHNFILDGTMIFDDRRLAILSYREAEATNKPERTRSRIRRMRRGQSTPQSNASVTSKILHLNDEFQGYTLVEIRTDSVTLRGDGKQIELAMYSDDKQDRGGTKQATATAVAKREKNEAVSAREERIQRIREARERAKKAREARENEEPISKPKQDKADRF